MSTRRVDGVLFVYNRPTLKWEIGEASNVEENIAAFSRHSRHRVWSVNTDLYWSTTWGRAYDPTLEGLDFAAIAIHYSVFGAGPQPYLLGDGFLEFLRRSEAYKVAFFQDEFHWAPKRFDFINEYDIDCVYTMLEQPYADQVYGEYSTASRVIPHLPGYVGPELLKGAEKFAKPENRRGIDIGYRGRVGQAYWGRTGRDKERIAEFREHAAGRGLVLDIETAEEKRIYGDRWHRFLADCKATLGAESGVSCFDPTGEVLKECVEAAQGGHEPSYEVLERGALGRWDGVFPYQTIGPRNFEAAALRVCQILFPGHYSGLMEPMTHYIPLERDFSNLDEVIERFRDPDLRRELAENARRDLIDSGANSYELFVEDFDQVLAEAGVGTAHSAELVKAADTALHRSTREKLRRWYTTRMGYLGSHHHGVWRAIQFALVPVRLATGALLRLRKAAGRA